MKTDLVFFKKRAYSKSVGGRHFSIPRNVMAILSIISKVIDYRDIVKNPYFLAHIVRNIVRYCNLYIKADC